MHTKNSVFVHPTTYIDKSCQIGSNTKIWFFCNIQENAKIGQNCVLGQNVNIGPNVRMGNNCKIQNNVSIYEGVTLEDDVFCGPSMVFTNVLNPRSHISRKNEFKPTIVKHGVTLGANCTILCGITIGEYAMVGAGSVVTKNLSPFGLYVGVPAKHRGFVCQCGELMPKNLSPVTYFTCLRCGWKFEIIDALNIKPLGMLQDFLEKK